MLNCVCVCVCVCALQVCARTETEWDILYEARGSSRRMNIIAQ